MGNSQGSGPRPAVGRDALVRASGAKATADSKGDREGDAPSAASRVSSEPAFVRSNFEAVEAPAPPVPLASHGQEGWGSTPTTIDSSGAIMPRRRRRGDAHFASELLSFFDDMERNILRRQFCSRPSSRSSGSGGSFFSRKAPVAPLDVALEIMASAAAAAPAATVASAATAPASGAAAAAQLPQRQVSSPSVWVEGSDVDGYIGGYANDGYGFDVDGDGEEAEPHGWNTFIGGRLNTYSREHKPWAAFTPTPALGMEVLLAHIDSTGGRPARPPLLRRNSTAAVQLCLSIDELDVTGIIAAACVALHHHIAAGAAAARDLGDGGVTEARYRIFDDDGGVSSTAAAAMLAGEAPSYDMVHEFFTYVYRTAQLERDCVIMALVYIERLLTEAAGGMRICGRNWRSIVLCGMILASKVWDDLSMWNADFSKVGRLTLGRVNELEVAVLQVLQYNVRVEGSDFARHYFHLRHWCMLLGAGKFSSTKFPPPPRRRGATTSARGSRSSNGRNRLATVSERPTLLSHIGGAGMTRGRAADALPAPASAISAVSGSLTGVSGVPGGGWRAANGASAGSGGSCGASGGYGEYGYYPTSSSGGSADLVLGGSSRGGGALESDAVGFGAVERVQHVMSAGVQQQQQQQQQQEQQQRPETAKEVAARARQLKRLVRKSTLDRSTFASIYSRLRPCLEELVDVCQTPAGGGGSSHDLKVHERQSSLSYCLRHSSGRRKPAPLQSLLRSVVGDWRQSYDLVLDWPASLTPAASPAAAAPAKSAGAITSAVATAAAAATLGLAVTSQRVEAGGAASSLLTAAAAAAAGSATAAAGGVARPLSATSAAATASWGGVLGVGVSGVVRVVRHRQTGVLYAMKTLQAGRLADMGKLDELRNEVDIMCSLSHPNIVRLVEIHEGHEGSAHDTISLVMELLTGGELLARLQQAGRLPEGECALLLRKMLSAVRHCHANGIVHRDLKLENWVFESDAPDAEIKLIDFGLSRHFRPHQVMHVPVGTPYTCAPEVLSGAYTNACDLWSLGVLAYLLLTGTPPFGGRDDFTVLAAVKRGVWRWPDYPVVSERARDFVERLLVVSPEQRMTADEATSHPWMRGAGAGTTPLQGQLGSSSSSNGRRRLLSAPASPPLALPADAAVAAAASDSDGIGMPAEGAFLPSLSPSWLPNPVVEILRKFAQLSPLRRLVLHMLAFDMEALQVEELRRVLEHTDVAAAAAAAAAASDAMAASAANDAAMPMQVEIEEDSVLCLEDLRAAAESLEESSSYMESTSTSMAEDIELRRAVSLGRSGVLRYHDLLAAALAARRGGLEPAALRSAFIALCSGDGGESGGASLASSSWGREVAENTPILTMALLRSYLRERLSGEEAAEVLEDAAICMGGGGAEDAEEGSLQLDFEAFQSLLRSPLATVHRRLPSSSCSANASCGGRATAAAAATTEAATAGAARAVVREAVERTPSMSTDTNSDDSNGTR